MTIINTLRISDIMETIMAAPVADDLWSDGYKIPWNDPAFSARMLREHLSQDHELASRRGDSIQAQAAWLGANLTGGPARVLDLGCGPGLYAPHFTGLGHTYLGIDFGPASIDHAQKHAAVPGRCSFLLGDVLHADFGGPHDLAMMLYGELNVFPQHEAARILARAHEALAPGGRIAIEIQKPEAVRRSGQGESWHAAPAGLFSEAPYLCLARNHWFEAQGVALQCFHVIDDATGALRSYRSTTQAYDMKQCLAMLAQAGFSDPCFHEDWPEPTGSLALVTATR